MKRRQFIAALGSAAAWPVVARAQQPGRMRRIGVLMNGAENDAHYRSYLVSFTQTLRKLGWRSDQNVGIDVRWSQGDSGRIQGYATELVALAPDAILASSTSNLAALLRATRTIPIVFVQVTDPVAQGFVPNLSRPGGHITGFSNPEFSVGGKWVELLKEMTPGLARVAVMFNPETAPQSKLFFGAIEGAARSIGMETIAAPVHDTAEIERVAERLSHQPNTGLVLIIDAFLVLRWRLIAELAARYRLPAISSSGFANNGGLMTYGSDTDYQFRQAAFYVDRILKGTEPGDLPVQLPTKFAFVVNLKAAAALGIEVPLSILMRVDELIE